jgi:hypothetical protein
VTCGQTSPFLLFFILPLPVLVMDVPTGTLGLFLLLLLLWYFTPTTHALVCESEVAANALVYQAIQYNAGARHILKAYSPATMRDLVTQRLHLAQAAQTFSLAAVNDTAFAFQYQATLLEQLEYVQWTTNTQQFPPTDNCTDLALNLATTLPPPAVRDVVACLVQTEVIVADSTSCEYNEVSTWDPLTHAYVCQCAEGFVCSAATNDEILATTAAWSLIASVLVLLLVLVILVIYLVLKVQRLQQLLSKSPAMLLNDLSDSASLSDEEEVTRL